MSSNSPILSNDLLAGLSEQSGDGPSKAPTTKKQFVEPEITFPVDVLEATTLFQLQTDSSCTECEEPTD